MQINLIHQTGNKNSANLHQQNRKLRGLYRNGRDWKVRFRGLQKFILRFVVGKYQRDCWSISIGWLYTFKIFVLNVGICQLILEWIRVEETEEINDIYLSIKAFVNIEQHSSPWATKGRLHCITLTIFFYFKNIFIPDKASKLTNKRNNSVPTLL